MPRISRLLKHGDRMMFLPSALVIYEGYLQDRGKCTEYVSHHGVSAGDL